MTEFRPVLGRDEIDAAVVPNRGSVYTDFHDWHPYNANDRPEYDTDAFHDERLMRLHLGPSVRRLTPEIRDSLARLSRRTGRPVEVMGIDGLLDLRRPSNGVEYFAFHADGTFHRVAPGIEFAAERVESARNGPYLDIAGSPDSHSYSPLFVFVRPMGAADPPTPDVRTEILWKDW